MAFHEWSCGIPLKQRSCKYLFIPEIEFGVPVKMVKNPEKDVKNPEKDVKNPEKDVKKMI